MTDHAPSPLPAGEQALQRIAAAYRNGDMAAVIAQAQSLPAPVAAHETVRLLLGLALHASGRNDEAAGCFRRLVRERPTTPDYWNNLAITAQLGGALDEAEHAFRRALSLAPDDAQFHHNHGLLLARQGRWREARQCQFDAVERAPGFIDARLQGALACHVCGDLPGEEAMLQDVAHWPPQPAEQALSLATMLSTRGEQPVAFEVLDKAVLPSGEEGRLLAWRITAMRASLHERGNQLEQAGAELARLPMDAIAALPAGHEAVRCRIWSVRATVLAREGDHRGAAGLWQHILDHAPLAELRVTAAFGLAAARDKLRQHAQAWEALRLAHALQCEGVRHIVPQLLDEHAQSLPMVRHRVTRRARDAWTTLPAPRSGQSPVFVVGFPRSGTTLLEQMIDAHPDFRSMDERAFIYDLIERMEHAGQAYPGDLATLQADETRMLRQAYDGMVAKVLPDLGDARLVDKNPLNMLTLPMMARLYPEARFILCLRHPCDVLLSCYMLPFRSPSFMTLCSSLPRLARGYVQAFEQWLAHVGVFAPRVLEWRYESVVSHFEEHIARLGDFLGIEDTAPMAGFAEHAKAKGYISTPSYAQVTQGIRRDAVGRWQAYREYFEPVLPILQPMIERLGYGR
jgi:Flp pilus assembly protein TadD